MSVLLRKPRIDEIADGLDSGTLKAFLEALNSNEGYEHYSLRGGNLPKGTAPFVAKCTLSIDGPAELSGVFVRYTNGSAKAAMVAFADLGSCITYDIDEERLTCRKVREKLSASELRRVISERLGGGGGVSADVIRKDENGNVIVNNALEITAEGNAVVGKNLEVDGGLQVNSQESGIYIGDPTSGTNINMYIEPDTSYLSIDVSVDGEYRSYSLSALPNKVGETSLLVPGDLKTLFGDQSLVGEGNIDLYRHSLSISGATAGTTLNLDFLSSSNLKCDSVQDLRTLLKVSGNKIEFLYGNLYQGPYTQCQLVVSADICQFTVGGTSTPINVTTVQDTVTTI